jgi:hypothetical protein
MSTEWQGDQAGNTIAAADAEIARLHEVLREIDTVEENFDRIKNIGDIVQSFRSRIETLDSSLSISGQKNSSKSLSHLKQPEITLQQTSPANSVTPQVSKALVVGSRGTEILPSNAISAELEHSFHTSQITFMSTLGSLMNTLQLGQVPDLPSVSLSIDHGANDSSTYHSVSDGSTACSISSGYTNDTGSEDSEDWCSPVEWQHHLILEAVMTEFYTWFRQGYVNGTANGAYGQSERSSSAPSNSWTNGSHSSANQSSISSTNNFQSSKRPKEDGDSADEDQDGNKRPRFLLEPPLDNNNKRRYACPFFKHDPNRHGQRGSCTGPGFKSISHLKYGFTKLF